MGCDLPGRGYDCLHSWGCGIRANYLDEGALADNGRIIVNPNWRWQDQNAEITFWFAADGVAGWWWLHAISPDINSSNGQMLN